MKPIIVEELSSPGCHNCKVFEDLWNGIKVDFPNVTMKSMSILTPEGQEMAQKYGIFASPGIVINSELFSTGGVTKETFIKKLKDLS
jgi:glutaredoxin